jgi:hypothetical protein
VSNICRRLDGIPLALELAAARVRMLSPADLAARLDDCFAVLTTGARAGLPWHRTLRATLDWSYALLTPREQAALRRLAVFPGPFDIDAAMALVADLGIGDGAEAPDAGPIDLLGRLVDKSLVAVEPTAPRVRYRLLEPVRQYAAGRLDEFGEREDATRCHRDVFLTRAYALRSDFDVLDLGAMASDVVHFRQASEWSYSRGEAEEAIRLLVVQLPTWFSAEYPKALERLDELVATLSGTDAESLPWGMARLALALHNSGRPDRERERALALEAVTIARCTGDRDAVANVSWAAADIEVSWGNPAAARDLLLEALDAAVATANPEAIAWCHLCLGWAAVTVQDLDAARQHFLFAADVERAGKTTPIHISAALAPLLVIDGKRDEGLRRAGEAVVLARAYLIAGVQVQALAGATAAYLLASDPTGATPFLVELLTLLLRYAGGRTVSVALDLSALLFDATGRPEPAIEALAAAAEVRSVAGEHGRNFARTEASAVRQRLEAAHGDLFTRHDIIGRERARHAALTEALAQLQRAV